jgi:hypothetical protein
MESLTELNWCDCGILTDADLTVLATMRLETLSINDCKRGDWTEASVQVFVGSTISQTLELFRLQIWRNATPIDDVRVITAFAGCHNLKKLALDWCGVQCVFGRSGLDGLQAMGTGCPLLAEVDFRLTVDGMYYIASHFTNLKTCMSSYTGLGVTLLSDLRTLYPAIEWDSNVDSDDDESDSESGDESDDGSGGGDDYGDDNDAVSDDVGDDGSDAGSVNIN